MSWKPRVKPASLDQQAQNDAEDCKQNESRFPTPSYARKPYQRNTGYNQQSSYRGRRDHDHHHQHRPHYQYNQRGQSVRSDHRHHHYGQQHHHPQPQQPSSVHAHINNQSDKVKFVKNTGKFDIEEVPMNELQATLQRIWRQYTSAADAFKVKKIICLCGPPGSGKSCLIEQCVQPYYALDASQMRDCTLDVSQMLSDVMKENNRKLIISKVYEKLLHQIAGRNDDHEILIIDGFLRKYQHVFVVQFLMQCMPKTRFIFLVINVSEQVSVERQLERGRKLVQLSQTQPEQKEANADTTSVHSKQRLKESDLDENAARKRFCKYNQMLDAVKYELMHTLRLNHVDMIDGNQPLQNVKKMVTQQLEKQDFS